jgi:hypothetical protein
MGRENRKTNREWAESKTNTRTRGMTRDKQYDNLLADITPSGLKYLELLWEQRIDNFKETHDLNKKKNRYKLLDMKNYYHMVEEEIFSRTMNAMATPTESDMRLELDSDTGMIYDEYGKPLLTVDFNENENGVIARNLEGEVVGITTDLDAIKKPKLSRIEKYTDWEYWEE